MTRESRQSGPTKKRRTTLSLSADLLTQAERIARARKVSLDTVISEAVSEGLRVRAATERSEQVLNAYKNAFSGFSEEEMSILDGVILERTAGRQPNRRPPGLGH